LERFDSEKEISILKADVLKVNRKAGPDTASVAARGQSNRLLKKSPGGHSEGAIKRSFLLATEESGFNMANQQQILRRAQDDHALSFFSSLLNRPSVAVRNVYQNGPLSDNES
jgi:hypothetical protein